MLYGKDKPAICLMIRQNEDLFCALPGVRDFLERCRNEGFAVSLTDAALSPSPLSPSSLSPSTLPPLYLTDDAGTAARLKKNGACVIGIGEGGFFPGAAVISSFEDLPLDFLLMVYDHDRHIPHQIAVTSRLVIRESVPEDSGDIRRMLLSCREGQDVIGITKEQMEDRRWFESYVGTVYALLGYGMWSVLERNTGALAGWCGLDDEGRLAYLIDESRRGKGYAIEACRAIAAYARDNLGMEKMRVRCRRDNEPSVKLALKLGAGIEWTG